MASDDSVVKNKDLDRMWGVAIVTKFEVMSQHLLGGTEENQNLVQCSRSPGRVLSRDLPNTKDHCHSTPTFSTFYVRS